MIDELKKANRDYEDGKFMVGLSKILGLVSTVAASYIGIRTALGANPLESMHYLLENFETTELIKRIDSATLATTLLSIPYSLCLYVYGSILKEKNKEKAEWYKLKYRNNEKLRNFFQS